MSMVNRVAHNGRLNLLRNSFDRHTHGTQCAARTTSAFCMKRRLGIAQALINDLPILIVDEPMKEGNNRRQPMRTEGAIIHVSAFSLGRFTSFS